jgi:hypothetical protein
MISDMTPFEDALQSETPFERLWHLARILAAEGHAPPAVLELFEQARTRLQAQQREQDEDVLLDVMDCIVGWCGEHMALFPSYDWSQK